jgi:alpha-tubulin suppressor-like RCC1 family protein
MDVSAGGFHSCAIAEDGVAYCWGSNNSGQLGTSTDADQAQSPLRVATGPALMQIDAGAGHTCAVSQEGAVLCWGDNPFGQVGNGNRDDQFRPVSVTSPGTFAQVSAGGDHTCALDAQGRASCWGRNNHGQLGRPSSDADIVPRPVQTAVRFATLSAGTSHTCGISLEAIAYCWGDNRAGQLGVGSASDSSVPIAIEPAFFSAYRIAAGFDHTCAVTLDSHFACWGRGVVGQLGVEGLTSVRTPVTMAPTLQAVEIAVAGEGWSCGIAQQNSQPWCWGLNPALELNTPVPQAEPGGLSNVLRLSLGDLHLCALTSAGEIYCWGRGSGGQLGRGDFRDSAVPRRLGG